MCAMTTPFARIPLTYAQRRLEGLLPGETLFTDNTVTGQGNDPSPLGYDIGSMEFFAYKDAYIYDSMLHPRSIAGKAAVARFVSLSDSGADAQLSSGLIVDLRRLTTLIEPAHYQRDAFPDDTEEQRFWEESLSSRIPVAAVASFDQMGGIEMNGDENAFQALQELMDSVDALAYSRKERFAHLPKHAPKRARRSSIFRRLSSPEEKQASPENS